MQKYERLHRVGKGSFGTVWLVKSRRNDGERHILKEVSLKGLPPSERKATMNEVAVLQKLHHPYIIAYRESFVERDQLGIVMEWAAGGDLGSLIDGRKRARRPFSENEVLRWAYQLISALSYCHHELRLLHRDLKPANVFLSASGDVKLGDFGISKLLAYSMDLAKCVDRGSNAGPSLNSLRAPCRLTDVHGFDPRCTQDAVRHTAVHEP